MKKQYQYTAHAKPPRNYLVQFILCILCIFFFSFMASCKNDTLIISQEKNDTAQDDTPDDNPDTVPENAGVFKIWTAGDSITYEYRGYRCGIWEKMTATGNEIDFVGTQHFDLGPNSRNPDEDHDGYRGYNIEQWRTEFSDTSNGKLSMMQAENPDILLIMLGTNNFGYQSQLVSDTPVETAVAQMLGLIDQIFEWFDDITIIVGTIPPMADSTFPNTHTRLEYVTQYNSLLKDTVESHALYDSRLFLSDNYSVLLYPDDFQDQLHPNTEGHDKIADEWIKAITRYLETLE